MNNFTLFCLVLVTLSASIVSKNVAGAASVEAICKKMVSDTTKEFQNAMGICNKSMKFKNGREKAKKMNCVIVCAMKEVKWLDKDGIMSDDIINSLTGQLPLPDELKSIGKELFLGCRNTDGASIFPVDEFCKSYEPFVKCLIASINKICPKAV